MTRRKKRNKSRILAFCAAVAFLAAVVLFAKFLRAYIDDRLVLKEQNDLRDMFENGASSMGSFLFPTAHAEEADENQPAARFAELYKINPDIIGWIAAGSEVSTPVVYRDNKTTRWSATWTAIWIWTTSRRTPPSACTRSTATIRITMCRSRPWTRR